MTLEDRNYILECVRRAEGDDLERATLAFSVLSEKDLDKQYGLSGKTYRQILDSYRQSRAKHLRALRALEEVLRV